LLVGMTLERFAQSGMQPPQRIGAAVAVGCE
jgi:hypothetical protein